MIKQLLTSLLLIAFATPSNAQLIETATGDLQKSLQTENKDTVAWIRSGILTIGANEGFLHNWAAGGELASFVVNGVFHGNITRLNHLDVWSNTLDMTYGLNYTYSNSFVPRKIDDRIDFTSQYGKRVKYSEHFYFAGLFNARTQFTKGYDYSIDGWETQPTSKFLSPAYFTLALGMEYRQGTRLNLFLSPIAAREVLADRYYTSLRKEGAFGIDSGETHRFQLGAYFSGRYNSNLSKGVIYSTRLDLYCNYLAKNTVDAAGNIVKKDNPGNIQWLWDNLLIFKTYKSLSVTFGITMMYDNNIPYFKTYIDKTTGLLVSKDQPGDGFGWVQVKQVFTVGLAYKL